MLQWLSNERFSSLTHLLDTAIKFCFKSNSQSDIFSLLKFSVKENLLFTSLIDKVIRENYQSFSLSHSIFHFHTFILKKESKHTHRYTHPHTQFIWSACIQVNYHFSMHFSDTYCALNWIYVRCKGIDEFITHKKAERKKNWKSIKITIIDSHQ